MKLNQLPNLRAEDFPSQQTWIGRLFTQINPFIQVVNQVFDNNIDYSTNIKSVSKTYTITSFQSFNFLWTYTDASPNDLRIISATKGSQQTPCILLASWSYDATHRNIQVYSMVEVSNSGAAALSGTYKFTVRVTV